MKPKKVRVKGWVKIIQKQNKEYQFFENCNYNRRAWISFGYRPATLIWEKE